jgi:hypothetical protein
MRALVAFLDCDIQPQPKILEPHFGQVLGRLQNPWQSRPFTAHHHGEHFLLQSFICYYF